ncbi:hypothetical protein [Polluticoccus soli]|uniref:hypothetical protein n=1 Tax=Polluticoccus soli TaxID=3034150 RepID=UPI0023E1C52E|nr:hypothetical protein [Flavipsychrobacter sp. JY13-12]
MKRFFLLGLTALIALSGCEKDFEVAAPYKDIMLVYGIIDPLDTAHYVRIQKAFLDENKSAIEMSKVPDSSYFPNIAVKVQEYTTADKLIREFALNKVDMNLEGNQKDPAANSQGFFTSPNYGYKFKETLTPFAKYRLIVTNLNSGKIDTSQFFRTINTDTSKGTDKFYISAFSASKYEIDFSRTTASHVWNLSGTKPLNGVKFQGKMRFNYIDKNALDGSETNRYVEMFIPAKITNGSFQTTTFVLETANKSFYSFLRDAIGLPPANVERYLGLVEVSVYAGSLELANYEAINSAQSGGLTGDQIKPNYTNMASQDALGLIGSRSFRIYENARLTDPTIDSLIKNDITAPLKIKGRAQ